MGNKLRRRNIQATKYTHRSNVTCRFLVAVAFSLLSLSRGRRSKGAADEVKASPDGSLSRWFETHVIGPFEAAIVSGFIALPSWRSQCLPGNNGAVTAGTLGKIFGALANYGEAESQRFVSSSVVEEVAKRVKGEKDDIKIGFDHPDGEYANLTARRSCGFFPWTSPDLHGAQYDDVIFSSEGMGGGFAMADPTNKLAIVYTKSVYEPLSVLGGSISGEKDARTWKYDVQQDTVLKLLTPTSLRLASLSGLVRGCTVRQGSSWH